MIDTDERVRTITTPAVVYQQLYCAKCKGKLCRVSLVPGAYAEDRCHHTIIDETGKRRTCGWETRSGPTR